MSTKTGYLLGMLLTIILCMILAWLFCCDAGTSGDTTVNGVENIEVENRSAVAAASMPFNIKGPDGKFAFNSNDNFNFNESDYNIVLPVTVQINEGISKLKTYFDADDNSNKMVDITGYYNSDERNTSAFENLGLARANTVKNYFVNQGINSGRINTNGDLSDALKPNGTIYRGPLSYKLYAQGADDKVTEAVTMQDMADAIKAEPLVLYFNYGEASVTLSDKQRFKIGDMSRYLDKVDGATITVEGHTDSQGSNTTNNRLGLERAEFAKEYLKNNGISGAKIKTVSKGESQPIVGNDTEADRARNRRAVVTIN